MCYQPDWSSCRYPHNCTGRCPVIVDTRADQEVACRRANPQTIRSTRDVKEKVCWSKAERVRRGPWSNGTLLTLDQYWSSMASALRSTLRLVKSSSTFTVRHWHLESTHDLGVPKLHCMVVPHQAKLLGDKKGTWCQRYTRSSSCAQRMLSDYFCHSKNCNLFLLRRSPCRN